MKPKTIKRSGMIVGCLAAVFIFLFACAVSWIITCGVIKLITMCFGWEYSWGIATGVWLIMFLIKHVFSMGEITVRK